MRWQRLDILILSLLGVLLYVDLTRAEAPTVLNISPASLAIGLFFSGQDVTFSGSILSDRDVIIEIKGPEEKSKFSLKGKTGPFWMNREKLEIEHVPFLYILLKPESYRPDKRDASLDIGIESLKKRAAIQPETLSTSMIFERFIELKRSDMLYADRDDALTYSPAPEGRKHFLAKFHFPSSIVRGEYKVAAIIIHNHKVEDTVVRGFSVKGTGIISGIQHLAYRQSLIYGVLAVLIALSVGVLIGFVFRGGKSH